MSDTSKNIVLCSDGTGNTVLKGRGTNVWKIYEAVDTNGHNDNVSLREQQAFYDDGVGTEENKLLKLAGGAFGIGLSRNVRELYTALCRTYKPGDHIFLFGFSRGAYTVRTLAGLIVSCGVLKNGASLADPELKDLVQQAYRCFRTKFRTWQGNQLRQEKAVEAAERVTGAFRQDYAVHHEQHCPDGKVPITFMGVWDTVDAVGLPFDGLTTFWNNFIYPFKFPDFTLSPLVAKACHAIAIDDERLTFHPVMWDEAQETTKRIEQVWFAGVHSNVGGGYPKQGMSLVALDWMMTKAEEQGLRFIASERERYHQLQNVHDKLYNSRSGLGVYYRYKPRNIGDICEANKVAPKIHASVLQRITHATQGYAPGNLPPQFATVSTTGQAASPMKIPPLIESAKGWITLRRYTHYALVFLTLVAAAFASRYKVAAATADLMVPDWFDAGVKQLVAWVPLLGDSAYEYILRPVMAYPVYGIALLVTLLACYGVGWVSRRKSEQIFQTF